MPDSTSTHWPYFQAREFVRSLGLKTSVEFIRWSAGQIQGAKPRPRGVPSNPHQVYPDDWTGFADWLGTDTVADFRRTFLPFEEARAFVVELGLRKLVDWEDYCAGRIPGLAPRPSNIPSNPGITYSGNGWCGVRYWLGVGEPAATGRSRMRPFTEARQFAQRLGLSGQIEWRKWVGGKMSELPPRPADIPALPQVTYKNVGWAGYGDFLGTGKQANHQVVLLPFKQARAFVRRLKLKDAKQWNTWARSRERPSFVPSNPDKAYPNSYVSMADWLREPYRRGIARIVTGR
jgi:hypothetical protein